MDVEAQVIKEPIMTKPQMCYCGMVLVVEIYLMWYHDQVPNVKGPSAYIVAHLMLLCLWPHAKKIDEQQRAPPLEAGPAVAVNAAGTSPPKPRTFFLDNVKIFCTVLVLVHHITIGFGGAGTLDWALKIGNFQGSAFGRISSIWLGLDMSFFMCLLFFVSGIFLPSSLKRKGTADFIRERVKRFGWPVIVTFFVASPVLRSVWGALLVGGDWILCTQASSEVCWFLTALTLFSVAYVIVPKSSLKFAFPSIPTLIAAGALLGVVQGLTYTFNYNADWLSIDPQMQGALPFDIAFFAAGCIAKESGWLDAISSLTSREYWLARGTSLIALAIWSTYIIVMMPDQAYVDCDAATQQDGKFAPHVPSHLLSYITLGAVSGVLSTTFSVSVLHFFAVHFNSQGRLGKIMSEAQYGVYVLQTLIIPLVMWSYVLILEAAGHRLDFSYCAGFQAPVSSTVIGQELIVGGWLYTIALVNLILWPLAHFFRQLPGVRGVL